MQNAVSTRYSPPEKRLTQLIFAAKRLVDCEFAQQGVPVQTETPCWRVHRLATGIATRAERASLLVCFPLLQQLDPILTQVEAAANSRIRCVTHDSLPENPVIGFGVDAVCIMKVEGLQVLSPPRCIVKLL